MAKTKAKPAPAGSSAHEPLCFVDDHGGAFSSLAAAIARAEGGAPPNPRAATTSAAVRVPGEIGAVLAEIGLAAPDVELAATLPPTAERVDVSSWNLALYDGEGQLERLALARIARDRIERRLRGGS
jgi:hypothetical protein